MEETVYSSSGKNSLVNESGHWISREFADGAGLFIFGQIVSTDGKMPKTTVAPVENVRNIIDELESIDLSQIFRSYVLKYEIPVKPYLNDKEERLCSLSIKIGHFKTEEFGSVRGCEYVVRWG